MLVEKFVDSPRHIEIQVSLFSESTTKTILLVNCDDKIMFRIAWLVARSNVFTCNCCKKILLFNSYFVL
jgi:hypothetical protein